MPKFRFFTLPEDLLTIFAKNSSQPSNSGRQLLYSYSKGRDVAINFYVDKEGKLLAEISRNGKRELALAIKGIPPLWQMGLDSEEKRRKLKIELAGSYSKPNGYDVMINPRGLGGWDDEQHRGYTYRKDAGILAEFRYCAKMLPPGTPFIAKLTGKVLLTMTAVGSRAVASAGLGVGMGAAIGSIAPGPGTVAGAVGGAVAGAVAGAVLAIKDVIFKFADDASTAAPEIFQLGWEKFLKPYSVSKGEGTYVWAKNCGYSAIEAIKIAEANVSIDGSVWGVVGYTSPIGLFATSRLSDMPQGWHFNTNAISDDAQLEHNGTSSGLSIDSRIELAIGCLAKAVNLNRQQDIDGSLYYLGYGLHALQDVFAHSSAFVTVRKDFWLKRYSHVLTGEKGIGADDPRYIAPEKQSPISVIDEDKVDGQQIFNQRYSDTKTMSLIYLSIYACNKERKLKPDIRYGDLNHDVIGIILNRIQIHEPSIDKFKLNDFLAEVRHRQLVVPVKFMTVQYVSAPSASQSAIVEPKGNASSLPFFGGAGASTSVSLPAVKSPVGQNMGK